MASCCHVCAFLCLVVCICVFVQVEAQHAQNSKVSVFAIDVEMAVVTKAMCGVTSADGACTAMDVTPTDTAKSSCPVGEAFGGVRADAGHCLICHVVLAVWDGA